MTASFSSLVDRIALLHEAFSPSRSDFLFWFDTGENFRLLLWVGFSEVGRGVVDFLRQLLHPLDGSVRRDLRRLTQHALVSEIKLRRLVLAEAVAQLVLAM